MKWIARIACFVVPGVAAFSSYVYVQEREARRDEAQMRASEILAVSQLLSQAMVRYTRENGSPPKTVDQLVDAGYFKGVPEDLIKAGYFQEMPSAGPVYFDPAGPRALGDMKPALPPGT